MYERYSRKRSWEFILLNERPDNAGGFRSAICQITGKGASVLHGEAGAHSIQHLTRSRKANRIHTSNASLVVFDLAALERRSEALVKAGDVRVDTFRGHGAGGQHRNVTDSAVRATHVPSGETATVTSGRSQSQNREAVLAVLMARLEERDLREHTETIQAHRRSQSRAGRAQTTRVYDLVRDMVRCERSGKKLRRVRRILDGDLSELLS